MLRAENRGHNSPAAQTSVPCPPTHFPASQEEASSRDPGAPVPGDSAALGVGNAGEEKDIRRR